MGSLDAENTDAQEQALYQPASLKNIGMADASLLSPLKSPLRSPLQSAAAQNTLHSPSNIRPGLMKRRVSRLSMSPGFAVTKVAGPCLPPICIYSPTTLLILLFHVCK